MRIFSRAHLYIFSFFFFICSFGIRSDLLSHSSSSDHSSSSSSSSTSNCGHHRKGACPLVNWQSLNQADSLLIYAGGKPIKRNLIAALGKKNFPLLSDLIKKREDVSHFFVVTLDKKGKEIEVVNVYIERGEVIICQPPCVKTKLLTPGTVGTPYRDKIIVLPKSPTTTYTLTKGHLPDGLVLSKKGVVAGIPTETGIFDFTVRAKSKCGSSRPYDIRIIIDCPEIVFITQDLPEADVGAAYSERIVIAGGVSLTTFSVVSGDLPDGLTLSVDGTISGIATAGGTYDFFVRAVNKCGSSGTKGYSIVINNPCSAPTITTTALPIGNRGLPYSQTVEATGGDAPITFSIVAGSLPTGYSLSSSGLISGTCDVGGSPTFTFTVGARSSCGSFDDQELTITIQDS